MMDAVDFLRTRARMCRKFNNCSDGCPIWEQVGPCEPLLLAENVEQTVSIVEQWAREHPGKTRQSELLKLFPDSLLDENGILELCPSLLAEECRGEDGSCYDLPKDCYDCRREFWMKEVE